MEHKEALQEALRMLDAFACAGVTHFDLTHLDIDGEKKGFRKAQSVAQLRNSMPYLLDSAPKRQNNVIIRPRIPDGAMIVQLDDLDAAKLQRIEPLAFITIATSVGNHQAWVDVQVMQEQNKPAGDAGAPFDARDFARRLRKGAGADANASGATRIAGTLNFKRKYQPDFPIVRILNATPGRFATRDELQRNGLVASEEPRRPAIPLRVSTSLTWPDYQRCVDGAPFNQDKSGKDISRADFMWAIMAAQRGHSADEIAARLMDLSPKAKENGERYARLTAENATSATERQRRSRA